MFRSILPKLAVTAEAVLSRRRSVCLPPCPTPVPACYWSVLPNGVRVISEQTTAPLACVALLVEAGARFETACNNGIAHFIEHLAFKGFRSLKRVHLEDSLRLMGARLTAHTSRELQMFVATCPPACAPDIINYLARIILELELDEGELQYERCNIDRELADVDADPRAVLFDYLHRTAFQGTPLAQGIIGPSKNIERFDSTFTRTYMKEHYQPFRLVLAASGAFTHHEIVCHAQSNFGAMEATVCGQEFAPARYTGSQITYRDDSMPFAHVALAVEAPGWGGPRYWRTKLLQGMVGRWHRSQGGGRAAWPRLAQAGAVAELCESYETFYIAYRDVGLWGVYFVAASGSDLEDMVYNVQGCWMECCSTVQFTDLQRAAAELTLAAARAVDGCVNSTLDMGRQVMYTGNRRNYLEVAGSIAAVEVSQVKALAEELVFDRCPAAVALGPTETLPDYTRLRAGMYWARL